jgi:hypothetical protein
MSLDFTQTLEAIRGQVLVGNAHIEIWRRLAKRLSEDYSILYTAPTFFGFTLMAHEDAAFMYAAKVFDTTKGSLKLERVLQHAKAHSALDVDVAASLKIALDKANEKLARLKVEIDAIRSRRKKLLAHLDPEAISRPEEIAKQSDLTADELKRVFESIWDILNDISKRFLDYSGGELEFENIGDVENALNLIARTKTSRDHVFPG